MTDAVPPRWAFRLVIWLISLLDRLRDLLTPSPILVLEKSMAFIGSSVVYACCNLNVADKIHPGWNSVASIAVKVGVNEESLSRLLKAANQLGFFELRGSPSRFEVRNNRLSTLLRGDQLGTLKPLCSVFYTEGWPLFGKLDDAVKTQSDKTTPSTWGKVHGAELWEYFQNRPERAQVFHQAMRVMDTQGMGAILADYNWSKHPRILDIGGATGSFLSEILNLTGGSGVVCEVETVVRDAKQSWAERKRNNDPLAINVLPRMSFENIDFFERGSIPVAKTGDAYLFRQVFHDWDDEKCLLILRNLRHAIGSSNAVLINVENSALTLRKTPIELTKQLLDVNMMVCAKGKERIKQQWMELLAASGFKLISSIEARAPWVIHIAQPLP